MLLADAFSLSSRWPVMLGPWEKSPGFYRDLAPQKKSRKKAAQRAK
jgi:hypothetical protein